MKESYQQPKQLISGAELLERSEAGYERYRLDSGVYQINFGFRNFGENEADWFSRASDSESDWQTPFKFDYDHPAVSQFEKLLFDGLQDFNNPEAIKVLTERLGKLIKSLDVNDPEFNNSLSDIVTSGNGMCDAKSVLFGSMLARNTNLEIQAITGQYGQVQDKVTYPFSHQWMRITDGNNVYLFDPMYEKLAVFEQDGEAFYAMDEQDSHFTNLTPACYPAGKLITQMGIQRWGGVRVVEPYDNGGGEVYVDNEESLPIQLTNNTAFSFEIEKEKELEIYNGAVKTGTSDTSLYFPVKGFQQIKTE
jgi:hypothetical protein